MVNKMSSFAFCAATAVTILAIFKNDVSALQCWECMSDMYGPCGDYFNTTRFPKNYFMNTVTTGNPRVVNCNGGPPQYGQFGYSRQVCVKKIETDRRMQRKTYTRRCYTLLDHESVGTCSKYSTNSDITVDFCEYCDHHECNGAPSMLKNSFWMGFVPSALLFLLLK